MNSSGLLSKVTYQYDEAGSVQYQGAPTQHDETNFGSGFVAGRGNLSSERQYDTLNLSQFQTNSATYNTQGSIITITDSGSHVTRVEYDDLFSDGATHNTLAYPTKVKDADWNAGSGANNFSTVKYNFDFGARTQVRGPIPAGQTQGLIQTFSYDSAGRVQQVQNENNWSYTRYYYGPNYVQSWSSVNNIADESYAIQIFDGLGRVIGAATNHPNSTGGYSAQTASYDVMGHTLKQSNPTEINVNWTPTGDDAAGWLFRQQTMIGKAGRCALRIRTACPIARLATRAAAVPEVT